VVEVKGGPEVHRAATHRALGFGQYLSKREAFIEKVSALQTEITNLDGTINTHYRAALDGGWTADELAAANLTAPKSATRKRAAKPRKQTAATTAPTAPTNETPAQQSTPAV